MLKPILHPPPEFEALITEDDTPVDNLPSEKQQRLLTEPLYSRWHCCVGWVRIARPRCCRWA